MKQKPITKTTLILWYFFGVIFVGEYLPWAIFARMVRPGQTGICGPAQGHQQGAPLSQDLPPQGEEGDRARRPPPSPSPSLSPTPPPPPPFAPQHRANTESPEETGQVERETQGEVTGQGRLCSPKMVQSAEGGKGRDERERIIVVVRSPCQENHPADAHTGAHKSVPELANLAWARGVHLDAPGQRHGQQPVSRTAGPGVVNQDRSSRGSVDTTKTRSGVQRVRMCKKERPIGAAKGKQTNTMALCHPASLKRQVHPYHILYASPPPPLPVRGYYIVHTQCGRTVTCVHGPRGCTFHLSLHCGPIHPPPPPGILCKHDRPSPSPPYHQFLSQPFANTFPNTKAMQAC